MPQLITLKMEAVDFTPRRFKAFPRDIIKALFQSLGMKLAVDNKVQFFSSSHLFLIYLSL